MRRTRLRMCVGGLGLSAVLLLSSSTVLARTKLVTLPERDMIRMDLTNPSHTLLEEERTINLQKGVNRIDFSWANVMIDKGSIQFRCLEAPGKVAVLNANYPPNENALFWEVSSDRAGPALFRISYLMGNISREISYQAVSDYAEQVMVLDYFMTIKNQSGERFEDCKVWLGEGRSFEKSLDHAGSKKMLSARFPKVPVRKIYIFDESNAGPHVRMYYRLENDKAKGLGLFPLENGKARIYQVDSEKTQAFLGEDWAAYTPIGNSMDLFLGLAKDVDIRRYVAREDRVNRRGVVYDLEREVRFEVQNFKQKPVSVVLKEHPGGEWVIKSVDLQEERGERDHKVREAIPYAGVVELERIDVDNLDVRFTVEPTKGELKYQLFVTFVLKNRW
ncbi:hypothetical protein ACFL59_11490 [Planctomycetota bacterium]